MDLGDRRKTPKKTLEKATLKPLNQENSTIGVRSLLILSAAGLGLFGAGVWVGHWQVEEGLAVRPAEPSFPQPAQQVVPGSPTPVSTLELAQSAISPVSNVSATDKKPSPENLELPLNAQAPEQDLPPITQKFSFNLSFDPLSPSTYPVQNRSLKGFAHLDEKSFLESHRLEMDQNYRNGMLMLKQNLVGTAKEKKRVEDICVEKYGSDDSLMQAPATANLGCLFWRIVELNETNKIPKQVKSKKRKSNAPLRALAKFKNSLPKTEKDWMQFSGADYYNALEVLQVRSLKEAVRMGELVSKADPGCTTAHARAALVRNMEEYLPDNSAFLAMENVTKSLFSCLKPAEDEFEILHVRMGLLYLERARFNESATHLELALRSESPSEEYRSLFWRGFIESLRAESQDKLSTNKYWEKLVAKFPLTLHGLVADELTGVKSFDRIKSKTPPTVSMYVGKRWDAYNLSMFVSGLLLARQEKGALERWSRYLTDNLKPADFESGLYLAMVHLSSGNTRGGISNVFGILRDFGNEKLTPEVLELLYPLRYQDLVVKHSKEVDAALVMSLIRQESSFNPRAQSPVGARGLMQVMPATAKRVNGGKAPNLLDPSQNIFIGTRYLRKLLAAHDDNYVFTLASYNAGPRPVNRWRERYDEKIPLLFSDLIAYPETRNYVSGLLRNMHWYRALLENVAHAREDRAELPWTAKTIAPTRGMFGLANSPTGIQLVVDNAKIDQAEGLSSAPAQ